MRHIAVTLIAFAGVSALAGCGPDYSPNTYASNAVQQANKADQGIVVGVRRVDVSAAGVAGAAVGASAGGIVGSSATPGAVGSAFGALGGALVGGIVGTAAEHTAADTFAFEYIVKKTSGELVSVTQRDRAPLALGEKVLVIAGTQARIVPDYTVALGVPDKPETPPKSDGSPKDAAATKEPPPGTVPPPDPVLLTPLPAPTTQASVEQLGKPIQLAPPAAAAASAGSTAAAAVSGASGTTAPPLGVPAVPTPTVTPAKSP